jgi:hypothetical protein
LPGELQLTILLPRLESPGNAAVVDLGAEKDEFAFHHVLGLKPVPRGTTAIEAPDPLGDDALQPEIGSCLEGLRPSQWEWSLNCIGERGSGSRTME